MKLAICFSGHLRKFEQTYPTFYFYLRKYHDCDIFIHTWDKLGYASDFKQDKTLEETKSKISEVERLYKPKKIIIESSSFLNELREQSKEYAPHLLNVPKPVHHMSSMFYKIYACNELRKQYQEETNVNYDWIIRARTDLIFNNTVTLPKTHVKDKIFIPHALSHPQWYNDQFAIGKSDEMDLYSSAFFDIPDYFHNKEEYYPEKFLMWSLNRKGLTSQIIPVYFNIFR